MTPNAIRFFGITQNGGCVRLGYASNALLSVQQAGLCTVVDETSDRALMKELMVELFELDAALEILPCLASIRWYEDRS